MSLPGSSKTRWIKVREKVQKKVFFAVEAIVIIVIAPATFKTVDD